MILTSCHAHVPGNGGSFAAAVDDEVVALRLASDGFMNPVDQQTVVVTHPYGCAKVRRIFLAKAHEQRAGTGQADAVAAFAELWVSGVMKPIRRPVSRTST